MTQFKSAAELKRKAVRKPISAREEMWAREEALIRDLASNEGAYGQYPKEFTTYNAASAFANTVNKRLRHKFTREECPLTGDFETIITDESNKYLVWIAYTSKKEEEWCSNA